MYILKINYLNLVGLPAPIFCLGLPVGLPFLQKRLRLMTAKDLSVLSSQGFCSDVLFFFPHHQLCVNQGFHFVGSSSVLCFLERINWPKLPLFSLMGPCVRLSIGLYTCQHPVQHHICFPLCSCPLPPPFSFEWIIKSL